MIVISFAYSLEKSPAMNRATEFQDSLGVNLPSCVKKMCASHVNTGFWMGLPLQFCKSFLPKEDATIALEDETGQKCNVKYIAYKHGLSAGWKSFVLRHNLIEEDVLVFQLVEKTKFKVYIFRADELGEAGHVLTLLSFGAHTEQTSPVTVSPKTKRNKHLESLSLTVFQKKQKMSTPSGPDVLECSRLSKPCVFWEVNSFQDFHIMVNGICIDHELPGDVRMGYYKLCVHKKEFLHDEVLECAHDKLVAGMIGETVSIANKIKSCKISTTAKEDYEIWDKFLSSFENMRDKIHTLVTLVFESEGAVDFKRYVEANNEHKRAEDEVKRVAAELKELEETAMKLEGITGSLKEEIEKFEHMLQEEFDAP
ncbi:B3 domain-containing protein Os01g0234100-like [Bidens hawaiensis]|uniref:B3 domain-containing protein Os01g0234100-like n=1 Tax=Bidens hawaiensis TaxID=980011 RepID=UPI00404B4F2B